MHAIGCSKLIKDNFHPGDKLVDTNLKSPAILSRRLSSLRQGKNLLIAKQRNRAIDVTLSAGMQRSLLQTVDEASGPKEKATDRAGEWNNAEAGSVCRGSGELP